MNMGLSMYKKFMERYIKHSGIFSRGGGGGDEWLGVMFGEISLSIFHIFILFKF